MSGDFKLATENLTSTVRNLTDTVATAESNATNKGSSFLSGPNFLKLASDTLKAFSSIMISAVTAVSKGVTTAGQKMDAAAKAASAPSAPRLGKNG